MVLPGKFFKKSWLSGQVPFAIVCLLKFGLVGWSSGSRLETMRTRFTIEVEEYKARKSLGFWCYRGAIMLPVDCLCLDLFSMRKNKPKLLGCGGRCLCNLYSKQTSRKCIPIFQPPITNHLPMWQCVYSFLSRWALSSTEMTNISVTFPFVWRW